MSFIVKVTKIKKIDQLLSITDRIFESQKLFLMLKVNLSLKHSKTEQPEESKYVKGGEKINAPVSTPIGMLALAICYDLRFPQLSTKQRLLGAQVLTYPSAFTVPTGRAHWEVLS